MSSFVSIAEVRALVRSRLSDTDLQVVIDREEAWLAGKVGTLTGARTDTYRPSPGDQPVYLQRLSGSVVVTDDGVTLAADTEEVAGRDARCGRHGDAGGTDGGVSGQRRVRPADGLGAA